MSHDAGPPGRAQECRLCPICAGLAVLREARPEAVQHLAKAGAELLLAAKALLDATPAADQEAARPRRSRSGQRGASGGAAGDGMQRIDIR